MSSKLEAQSFQRLHPRTYLERFLAEGIRPDGRTNMLWRNASVNIGSITTADGSALARVGDTTVICGVKAEIAEPDLTRPNHGFIVPNVDLPAICSPLFKSGPPGEEAQALSERLNDSLISSKMIPLDSLCIEPGRAVWVLYIDATCINYDGNPFDATLLAMTSALLNTQLPRPTWSPDTLRTTVSRSIKDPLQINKSRIPQSFTFGLFSGSSAAHLLADPTSFEEPLLLSTINIVIHRSGSMGGVSQTGAAAGVKSVDKQGGNTLPDALVLCTQAAKERLVFLNTIIDLQLT